MPGTLERTQYEVSCHDLNPPDKQQDRDITVK